MRIAIATSADWSKVSGHAGRARRWLVYSVGPDGQATTPPERVELTADMVFHNFADDRAHPLDGITAVIAASSGEGFMARMGRRGIDARMTAETDPAAAVREYVGHTLPPPKPRPIGKLLCQVFDLFSKHK
jgi:predicted Fe-Mo cluster-binding NifX family protein